MPGSGPGVPGREPVSRVVPGGAGDPGPGGAPVSRRSAFLALIAAAAASAALGLLTGLIWSALAPRALLVVQSPGVAYVVNTETSAYIVADAWFCLLTAIAGLICGLAGYLLAVRRYGAAALTGLVLGAVAASLLAMWVGEQQGLAGFRSRLAASAAGTRLREPLTLGGHGELAFWALFAAAVVGGIELVRQSADRRRSEAAALTQAPSAGPAGSAPGFGDPGGAV
jgi:hypothetical protein